MKKLNREPDSERSKVVLFFKEIDSRIDLWVEHILDQLEKYDTQADKHG